MARDSPSSPPGGTWEKISPCSRYLHVNVDCSCTENKEKDKGREKLLVGDGKSRRFLHERSIAFITERKEEKHAARGYFCVCNIDSLQTRKWIRRSLRRQRHVTWTPFNVKMAEIFHNFRNIFPKISPVDVTRDVGHFCFCVRKDLTKRSAANWRQAITAARAISCHLDDLTGISRSNASSHRFEPKRLLIELHRSYRTASKT